MKNAKSKTTAVSLFLLFAMTVSLVALPAANAQNTGATYPFIGALPNPVGVNQEVLLHVGITQQLSSVALGWEGLSVTITKPDGTTETISNIRTDSTGGTGRVYVPTMAGTYYLQTNFPEQTMPTTTGIFPAGTVMKASKSEKLALVVQEEALKYYPGSPLPTEYWTRPINAQHREWASIAGSNFMDDEYNEAPDAPHVLWTKPLTMGGLAGGYIGEHGYNIGDAYQGLWSSRFIIGGILVYSYHTGSRPLEYTAVDLRTGEELWTQVFLDNRTISTAQIFYWDSYNSHGAWPYLWVVISNDWYAFNPFDGKLRFTITNMPSGTNLIDTNDGRIYRYSISTTTARMLLWNLTALISNAGGWGSNNYPGPFGTYNASATTATGALTTAAQRAYALNFTFPTDLQGSVRAVKLGEKVVGGTANRTHIVNWAFSLKPGQEGTLLYNKALAAPTEWNAGNQTISWSTDIAANIGLAWSKEVLTHWAYSLETGEYLWKTEVPQNYLDIYSVGRRIAYDKMYSVGQSGHLYCFNTTNGKLLWIYNATDPYSEFLWGNNWSLDIQFIQGGKIYLTHSEHSPVNPLFRGPPFICLNATTGEEIWRVDGLFRETDWGGSPIMGDSVIVGYNSLDQRIYAFGKGPSATTVTASPKVSVHGSSVLVEGMVTDISPGTKDYALTARFPNGVPAVADENVGEWMKYVYAQFARPADAVGVEVVLSVLDPNNNYYEVGRATSDANGFFSCAFTPEVPGKYTVFASFEGSGAYYGSSAETAINVEEAPQPTPPPTPTPAPMTDTYILGSTAGIIVAIVVVGLLLVLLLRKRP